MDGFPTTGYARHSHSNTHSTAAEMVYGTMIRLPGEFFTPSPNPSPADSSDYVSQLKTHMQQIRPAPPRSTHRSSHVNGALSTCTHVFIRHDAVRKPLQPPYDGPYPVVKRTDKHYTIDINGRRDTVSLDCLNPAHLDIAVNTPPSPQTTPETPSTWKTMPIEQDTPRVTRSGRQVHWPKHLSSYVS